MSGFWARHTGSPRPDLVQEAFASDPTVKCSVVAQIFSLFFGTVCHKSQRATSVVDPLPFLKRKKKNLDPEL